MEEQLISFKTAKLAKEKGFDIPVLYAFDDDEGYLTSSYSKDVFHPLNYNIKDGHKTSKPTQSLLQKWLREVHNLHITVYYASENKYEYSIGNSEVSSFNHELIMDLFDSYEEALEEGLLHALNLIK